MKTKIPVIFLILSLLSFNAQAQELVSPGEFILNVQPAPKEVKPLNIAVVLDNDSISILALKNEEKKAANYLKYIFTKKISTSIYVKIHTEKNNLVNGWKINLKLVDYKDSFVNNQYYSIQCSDKLKEINITSPSQLGLLYGVVTFSKYFSKENKSIKINLFDVNDWPVYSRRSVSAVFKPADVDDLLDYALMNKIETVGIASRIYQWHSIDNEYKEIIEKIKVWKDKFGGPKILQMQNIYDKKMIEISNPNDIDSLKKVIEYGINNNIEKLMILADDTPPFKFGEGYVLTNDNDKKQFKSMAESHCYLMKQIDDWIKFNNYDVEIYYCPAFYTYEDMHYGDMNLYKNTPWERDVFQSLINDLNYIGLNMPDNVYIIWTGPNVRSRTITLQDLNDWTKLLNGRVPFLFDNTIYSHFSFTSTPLFTAYKNELPLDFHKHTAGNGMFLNCDANLENTKVAVITASDYWWDPENYNPEKSLNTAMENYYGKENLQLLFEFKDVELMLRKKIGERKLWFEADTLWTIIRKIRFITEKNPFYYHLNYNRLKALRMQLKNSVPEAVSMEEFIKECLNLHKKRIEIIDQLSRIDNHLADRIKTILVPLPDFNSIQ